MFRRGRCAPQLWTAATASDACMPAHGCARYANSAGPHLPLPLPAAPTLPASRLKPLDVAPLPEARLRRWCHHLAYSKWFDHAMLAGIILNIVLTATTFYNQPDGFTRGGVGSMGGGRTGSQGVRREPAGSAPPCCSCPAAPLVPCSIPLRLAPPIFPSPLCSPGAGQHRLLLSGDCRAVDPADGAGAPPLLALQLEQGGLCGGCMCVQCRPPAGPARSLFQDMGSRHSNMK